MSRQSLERRPAFAKVSPQVGSLDDEAFDDALAEDADDALAMLADMSAATDPQLRALARRLAGRVVVRLARQRTGSVRGIERLRSDRFRDDGSDLDLDASIDALIDARVSRRPPILDDLVTRRWTRVVPAVALVVDRSGSMGGERLAAAALAAAVIAMRTDGDYSALAFAREVIVVKSQDATRGVDRVVDDLLALRGFGTTDLAGALDAARAQLMRSSTRHRMTIVCTDARATAGGDPIAAAKRLSALGPVHVIAPAGDRELADALARIGGGRCVECIGPSAIPDTISALLA